jgi:hypothetical protein
MESDRSKIEGPPRFIDGVVRILIPPAAREATVGDLWERYRSSPQYAVEALRVLPFIVASQIRRGADLPILGLQAFILFSCFDGLEPSGRYVPLWATAAVPTLAAIAGLVLRDAYRETERRSVRRGVIDALVAACCVLLAEAVLAGFISGGHLSPEWLLPGRLAILGTLALPMLCVLRIGPGLIGESNRADASYEFTAAQLAREYSDFERRARWRNRTEVAAGLGCVLIGSFVLWRFNPPVAPIGWMYFSTFACVLAFLAVRGSAPMVSTGIGFASVRNLYKAELARQHRLRRFLWWWYFVPVFLRLGINLIKGGTHTDQLVLPLLGIPLALLLGTCIARLNRERSRKVQDTVRALSGLRERLREENDLA